MLGLRPFALFSNILYCPDQVDAKTIEKLTAEGNDWEQALGEHANNVKEWVSGKKGLVK